MTVHPNGRDWTRLNALVDEDPIALRDAAWRLTAALAAADHRATRAEARADIRKRQVAYWRAETQKIRDRLRELSTDL